MILDIFEKTEELPVKEQAMGKKKRKRELFFGAVYENEDAGDNTAHRFEQEHLLLNDVVIQVSINPVKFGSAKFQRFEIPADGSISFEKVDISTLFFKNKTAGLNGVTNIIGTVV